MKKKTPNTAPPRGIFDVRPTPNQVRRGHDSKTRRAKKEVNDAQANSVKAALSRPTHQCPDGVQRKPLARIFRYDGNQL